MLAPSLRAFRCLPFHLCYLLVIALSLAATQARGDDPSLIEAVQGFLYQQAQPLGQEVMIDVSPPSAHLPACIAPEPFFPNARQAPIGRVSVGVRCGEGRRQVRYLQAQVDVVGSYMVAAQDIPRKALITQAMITQRQGNLGDLTANALTDEDAIIGKVAQRPLRQGEVFQAHALQTPDLVERGQRVTVSAQGPGFRVTREGEALESGGEGARIRVRFDTRELVTARVTREGALVVDF
ncbi:flagellar basal body P-ring formation chaperone FlgA [Vreelandella malpeensis]|uniref:Flagella basal body P-ring formation protein FlgA n=1 Tax=Vreelandella malpeensis TaxID=1172368 RepID=A0ABS8DQE8_9GAMM|nr:flagellar basal body P-ring formation chaperone FlgA [Halomonas malpeensis]MCB8888532.1 flagellar basal body P-ring formation protein FlgA [Halomonas malpeensis]